jgi:hypothetical protein
MVDGIPLVNRAEEFCDSCALGKQQRLISIGGKLPSRESDGFVSCRSMWTN